MAKGIKTGGRNFKKGHKFGKGAPRLSAEVKAIRKISISEVVDIFNKYLLCDINDLIKIIKDKKNISVFEYALCRALQKAIAKGDFNIILEIFNRLIGKVTEKIDHTTEGEKLNKIELVLVGTDGKEQKANKIKDYQ